MWKIVITLFSVAGGLILAGAEISPTEATSNLGAWVEYFGVDHVPLWLQYETTDDFGLIVGGSLIVIALVLLLFSGLLNKQPRMARIKNKDFVIPIEDPATRNQHHERNRKQLDKRIKDAEIPDDIKKRFISIFASTIAAIDPTAIGDADAFQILNEAYPKHLEVVTELRHYLAGEKLAEFNLAWNDYHARHGVKYLEQYSKAVSGSTTIQNTNILLAIERLNKLLSFCKNTVNEHISLSTVSRLAYEKHRTQEDYYLGFADVDDGFAGVQDESSSVLDDVALAIAVSGITLYGKHCPSTALEKMTVNIENHYQFRDNGNSLHIINNETPKYIDISIKQSDVDNAINKINEYSEEK